MSATVDTNTDWVAEAVRLRVVDNMPTLEIAERVGRSASQVRRKIAEAKTAHHVDGAALPGQTTVDEQIAQADDSPSIVWTGENWPEFREFLGRPETSALISYNFDLPCGEGDRLVRARPGDTVIRTGDGIYAVERPEDDPEHPDTRAEFENRDPLDEFKDEAGVPVGDMPPVTPPEPEGTETRLAGTRQMALDFGENADIPIGGTLVIKSDKLASGFYGLGDIVTGTFTARVVDVAGKERHQKASDEFRAQPQHHVALITELTVSADG